MDLNFCSPTMSSFDPCLAEICKLKYLPTFERFTWLWDRLWMLLAGHVQRDAETKSVPTLVNFSCKGRPLDHQNLGFSRLPTSQGTPQNWVRSKFHPRTRDMARGPKLKFLWGVFIGNWGPKFKITDFLQKQVKIDDSFC